MLVPEDQGLRCEQKLVRALWPRGSLRRVDVEACLVRHVAQVGSADSDIGEE